MPFKDGINTYQINANTSAATASKANIEMGEDVLAPNWMFWKHRRYLVAILALFGFLNCYALRVNMSIAIVAMTSNRTFINDQNQTITEPEFDWDSKMQGYILSSFFYGYILTQLLGGYVAARIGGKRVFGYGIGITAILTVITPWLVQVHVGLLFAARIIEGVFEGVTFPSIHAVWAKWSPPLERSRLATVAFSGSFIGTVIALPACAALAESLGWPSIFYFFGTTGIIWAIIWMVFIAESPAQDPRISKAELKYITDSLEPVNQHPVYPWRKFVTSLPVWAIVVSHFSENWGFYTMLTQLPKFMSDTYHYNLGKAGFMSALPYVAMAVFIQFSGQFADWFRERKILTTTQVRKVFNCGAFIAQTVFMLGAAYLESATGCLVCLTMAVGLGAFAWAGFSVNHLDLAPQYASILMGFGNTIATLPGIVSPIITGYVVTTPTKNEWQYVFFIAAGIYMVGSVFYGIFASGELQPWAMDNYDEEKNCKSNTYNLDSRPVTGVTMIGGKDNKSYIADEL